MDFKIVCWNEVHWESLKKEWEANDFGRRAGFNIEDHVARRDAARIDYQRQLWFDITDVWSK